MKSWKKRLALLLCISILATTPMAMAEELTAEQAQNLVYGVANHLSAYTRDESVTTRSLYKAALEKLILENPGIYDTVLKAMLESVDEYSEYYTPEEAQEFAESISGEIIGIGVTIEFGIEKATISSVIPDTPADRIGLSVGDVLVSADGVAFEGLNSEIIIGMIRGEEGTTVSLEVERNGAILRFDIVREPVIGTSVESEVFEDGENKAMRICVYGFVKNTAEKFKEALDEAEKENITNLIIDLRNNGGGLLNQAVQMADYFVPEGKTIVVEDHKNPIFNKTYTGSFGKKKEYDTVILMNEYSASASEVFAAALRENDLAVIIGTKSYGKGTIQSINSLENGGMIKYTSGFYLTPLGDNLTGVGLTPDAVVGNTYDLVNADEFGDFGYTKVYKVGDSDSEVRLAKEILSFFDLYRGEINETFDNDLYYAIYAFQSQARLFPYGVLDLTTQNQLRNYLSLTKVENDDQLDAAFTHFGMTIPKQ